MSVFGRIFVTATASLTVQDAVTKLHRGVDDIKMKAGSDVVPAREQPEVSLQLLITCLKNVIRIIQVSQYSMILIQPDYLPLLWINTKSIPNIQVRTRENK